VSKGERGKVTGSLKSDTQWRQDVKGKLPANDIAQRKRCFSLWSAPATLRNQDGSSQETKMATVRKQDGDGQKPRWRLSKNQDGDDQKARWRRSETKMVTVRNQDGDGQNLDGGIQLKPPALKSLAVLLARRVIFTSNLLNIWPLMSSSEK